MQSLGDMGTAKESERMTCRHEGGEESCTPECMVLYGEVLFERIRVSLLPDEEKALRQVAKSEPDGFESDPRWRRALMGLRSDGLVVGYWPRRWYLTEKGRTLLTKLPV